MENNKVEIQIVYIPKIHKDVGFGIRLLVNNVETHLNELNTDSLKFVNNIIEGVSKTVTKIIDSKL